MLSNRKWILLIAAILLAAVMVAGMLMLTHTPGTQVVVTYNGKLCGTYDLHRDLTVVISPEEGGWYNTLEIKDGRASIIESDCDNQICVHTPALQEDVVGIIVCLPHGIVVELQEAQ